jgi:hypothetical protein
MRIVVIDGQGGGIGKTLCQEIKKRRPALQIVAVGTNALATAAMLKAGADQGATGENAVRVCAREADIILGPMGIVLCDAMLGEITAEMAAAVAKSRAHKILIPIKRCQITVAGVSDAPLAQYVEWAVDEMEAFIS